MDFSINTFKLKNTNINGIGKVRHLILLFLSIGLSTAGTAQTKKKETATAKKPDTTKVKQNNFMDMGAGTMGQIFGENLDGQSKGKKLTFLELLEKMDMPADQKAEYKNWYFLQAKDLNEKQKDSLGKAIEKKIMEANNNPKNR